MRPAVLAAAAAVVLAGCAAPAAEVRRVDAFGGPPVVPGAYAVGGEYARALAPGPHALLDPETIAVESEVDGAAIQLAIVRPDVAERVPVLVVASPYFVDLATVPFDDAHPNYPAFLVRQLREEVAPHGYALALVAARGTAGSGGCYGWWSAEEKADLSQAVTWLASQEWSTGKVAMIGMSMGGATAWEVASVGNPHLAAIVPIAAETDLYSWFVRNGTSGVATAPGGTTAFWALYGASPASAGPAHGRSPDRMRESACPDVARRAAASAAATAAGDPDPFGEWRDRDLRPGVEANWTGPTLLVHSFPDSLAYPHLVFPWIERVEARASVQMVLGQWGHQDPDDPDNPTPRWDFAEIALRFLDRHLRGNESVALGPRVQVADSGGRWRAEDAWPPRDAVPMRFHLAPDGVLAAVDDAPAGEVVLSPDPSRVVNPVGVGGPEDSCAGCARFETEAFAREFRFAGLPRPHLTVTPTGPGGHVTAHLYVATDEGDQYLASATMDLRFAEGDGAARDVTPNEPIVARMEIEPVDAVVPAGARLALVLTQGGYGGQPATGGPTPTTAAYYRSPVPTYPVRVAVGGDASVLTVLAFDRAEFFTVPGEST